MSDRAEEDSSHSGRGVARASGVVSGMTLVSRVLGMIRDITISTFFGAGTATDAFFVAFKVPNLLRRLVAEGSLATAFVPVFMEEKARSEDASKQAFAAVTSFTLLLTLILSALGIIYSDEITHFFAPGFGTGTDKTQLASSLMQLMFPYIILVSTLALASGVLNSLGHFAMPAFAPALLNIAMISGVFIFASQCDEPIYALAYSVLAGGVLALLPQIVLLWRLGYRFRLASPFGSPPVKKLCRLMLPTVFSASLYQVMVFINTLLASLLVERSVSWLFFADRVFQFPLGVFSIAVATAVLPTLSKHAADKNLKQVGTQLQNALAWITFITVPATVGLVILAEPIISVLFEHGRFTHEDTHQTASALVAYSIGLWSVSCQSIIVRAYLAQKNALFPSLVTCGSIALNILLAFLLMGAPQSSSNGFFAEFITSVQAPFQVFHLGHVGLALAGSCSSFFSVIVLTASLSRVQLSVDLKRLASVLGKTFLASVVMGALLLLLQSAKLDMLTELVLGVLSGILVFGISALALRMNEASQVKIFILERLNRKTGRPER